MKEFGSADFVGNHLGEFCSSLVHDLRLPITQISLSVQILERQTRELKGDHVFLLEKINQACQKMSDQIDSIRQLFCGQIDELKKTEVDLSRLARGIAGELREREPERVVRFSIQNGLTAFGDPKLLRTVLLNLFENAWKFTGTAQGPRIRFGMVHAAAQGKLFFVQDNGRGFDEQKLENLFQPFQRLQANDSVPGTGIGLSLVRRIIELHGGMVLGGNNRARGARISFFLPARPAAASL